MCWSVTQKAKTTEEGAAGAGEEERSGRDRWVTWVGKKGAAAAVVVVAVSSSSQIVLLLSPLLLHFLLLLCLFVPFCLLWKNVIGAFFLPFNFPHNSFRKIFCKLEETFSGEFSFSKIFIFNCVIFWTFSVCDTIRASFLTCVWNLILQTHCNAKFLHVFMRMLSFYAVRFLDGFMKTYWVLEFTNMWF